MKIANLKSLFVLVSLLAFYISNAQDTTITITKYYDYSKLDSYNKTWKIDGKTYKSVYIGHGEITISTKEWKDTICYSKSYTFEPRLPKGADPYSIATISYKEDSIVKTRTVLQTIDGKGINHPCNCFMEVLHTETLDLDCILSCELDTIRQRKYISHYLRDGKLSRAVVYKDSSWIASETRTYDSKGNWLTEWTRCDTFSYVYDSLNRRVYQYFNYRCDKFEYFIETEYRGDSAITMGTQDGITKLSSIKTRISDSTYLYESFYSNGDVHKTIYLGKDEDHPLSQTTLKKNGDIEKTEFEYVIEKDSYKIKTIKNGNQTRMKTVQTITQ